MLKLESFSTHSSAEEVFVHRNFALLQAKSTHPYRFAFLAHATVIIGILSGSTILYNIQYMTMPPSYICDIIDISEFGFTSVNGQRPCTKEEICTIPELKWKVDFTK